jgi:hypothetical protein
VKALHVLAVTVLIAALSPLAGARSTYLADVKALFKLEKDPTIAAASCKYCHLQAFGGAGWNAFGTGIRDQYLGAAKSNAKQAMYLQLKANKDSDSDGYSDVLEVVAKTLPGDAKSKPSQKVADLQKSLTKMGGVDAFKPK